MDKITRDYLRTSHQLTDQLLQEQEAAQLTGEADRMIAGLLYELLTLEGYACPVTLPREGMTLAQVVTDCVRPLEAYVATKRLPAGAQATPLPSAPSLPGSLVLPNGQRV